MIASFLILLYVSLPTKNHYWDGVGFALNIEGIGEDGDGVVRNQGDFRGISSIYYNPNHLLFNLSGHLIYGPMRTLVPGLRGEDYTRTTED